MRTMVAFYSWPDPDGMGATTVLCHDDGSKHASHRRLGIVTRLRARLRNRRGPGRVPSGWRDAGYVRED